MNISGLRRSYELLFASRQDLFDWIDSHHEQKMLSAHLLKVLRKQRYKYNMLKTVYAIGVIAVILIILGKDYVY